MVEENADKEKKCAGAKCLAKLLTKALSDDPSKFQGANSDEEELRVKDHLLREPNIDRLNQDRIGFAVELLWGDEMDCSIYYSWTTPLWSNNLKEPVH